MKNWHCSLSAIGSGIKTGGGGKRFIPPPRKIVPVPWNSTEEMLRTPGFPMGEWVMSTNQYGHHRSFQWQGTLVARLGVRRLMWLGGENFREIHQTNFVGHYEEPES